MPQRTRMLFTPHNHLPVNSIFLHFHQAVLQSYHFTFPCTVSVNVLELRFLWRCVCGVYFLWLINLIQQKKSQLSACLERLFSQYTICLFIGQIICPTELLIDITPRGQRSFWVNLFSQNIYIFCYGNNTQNRSFSHTWARRFFCACFCSSQRLDIQCE